MPACVNYNPLLSDKKAECRWTRLPDIREVDGKRPSIHPLAYVDDKAVLMGDIEIGEYSSVWPGAVLRADDEKIRIGKCSNIQENAILHASFAHPVIMGDYVTVCHNAVVHGCTLRRLTCISISAVVMDGAQIGEGSVVDAMSLVTENSNIPPRTLIHGVPGHHARVITDKEYKEIKLWAEWYVAKVRKLKSQGSL